MTTDKFDSLRAKTSRYGERNDCTVKAWAIAAGISYEKAWEDLFAVGRKMKRGIYMRGRVLQKLCEMRGKRATDVTDKWKRKGALTLTTAPRVLPGKGIFLVYVRGHVCCYRAGELHDWSEGRRHRVQAIIRINTES